MKQIVLITCTLLTSTATFAANQSAKATPAKAYTAADVAEAAQAKAASAAAQESSARIPTQSAAVPAVKSQGSGAAETDRKGMAHASAAATPALNNAFVLAMKAYKDATKKRIARVRQKNIQTLTAVADIRDWSLCQFSEEHFDALEQAWSKVENQAARQLFNARWIATPVRNEKMTAAENWERELLYQARYAPEPSWQELTNLIPHLTPADYYIAAVRMSQVPIVDAFLSSGLRPGFAKNPETMVGVARAVLDANRHMIACLGRHGITWDMPEADVAHLVPRQR